MTLLNIIIIYAHEFINRQTDFDHFITAFIGTGSLDISGITGIAQ